MIPAPALLILRFRVSSERTLGGARDGPRAMRARDFWTTTVSRARPTSGASREALAPTRSYFVRAAVGDVRGGARPLCFPSSPLRYEVRFGFCLIITRTFPYGNINPHFDENMLFREWSPLSTVLLLQRREPLRASEPGARGTGPCQTSRPNPEVAVAEPLPNAQGASRGVLRGIYSKNQLNLNLDHPPTQR